MRVSRFEIKNAALKLSEELKEAVNRHADSYMVNVVVAMSPDVMRAVAGHIARSVEGVAMPARIWPGASVTPECLEDGRFPHHATRERDRMETSDYWPHHYGPEWCDECDVRATNRPGGICDYCLSLRKTKIAARSDEKRSGPDGDAT